jgi:hypothetical protein
MMSHLHSSMIEHSRKGCHTIIRVKSGSISLYSVRGAGIAL